MEAQEDPARPEESAFYAPYAFFARALRTWFIAYGIGGPVLLFTSEGVSDTVARSGKGAAIAYSFLGGVALQIVLAMVYKTAMWYLYMGEGDPDFRDSRRYRSANRISEAYWIEFVLDLLTLVLFGFATLTVLSVLGI